MREKTKRAPAVRTALIIGGVFLLVISGTILVSFFIRGYRPAWRQRRLVLQTTGLLVANSQPQGALVYLDDKLVTATNDTLNLPPGEYQVKIAKDGYLPWEKKLTIKKEVVTQTNALLFRNAPDLRPLTHTGAVQPQLSPDKSKIVYAVTQGATPSKNGVWLLDLASNLPLSRANSKQLTGPLQIDWEKARFIWSPDQRKVLLLEDDGEGKVKSAFLIPTDHFTAAETLGDVSFRLNLILQQWQEEKNQDAKLKLNKLPPAMRKIATASAQLLTFSPDEERFFYLATDSAKIPENLTPHPPARSTQPEERTIKARRLYVYDLKEDANFRLGTAEELGIGKNFQVEKKVIYWLDNRHLLFIDREKSEIKVMEADATNEQTVYAGPFADSFVFPSPSGKSLIILTSLHPDSPGNLYEVKIR